MKPKVSFVVMTYNQVDFVLETLQSALQQDYIDMEFVISDDASTDGTWERIVSFVEQHDFGGRKVILNRNVTTIGIMEHYNKLLYDLTSGEIVVINEGDDISLPHRTKRSVEVLEKYGLMQVTSDYGFVTNTGRFFHNDRRGGGVIFSLWC